MEPQSQELRQEPRHVGTFTKVSISVACLVYAVMGALHVPYVASALVGDYSRTPLRGWLAGYSALRDLDVGVPMFMLWSALWTLFAWSIGARLLTVVLAFLGVAWLGIMHYHADWHMANALIIAISVTSAWAGYVFASTMARASRDAVPSAVGGLVAVGATLLVSVTCLGCIGPRTNPSTNFSFLVGAWMLCLGFLLGPAFIIGYQFLRAWSGSHGRRSPLLLLVALMPLIGSAYAFSQNGSVVQTKGNNFRSDTAPRIIAYIDKKIAQFPMPPHRPLEIRQTAELDVFSDDAYEDKIIRAMHGSFPLDWTERTGFNDPVELLWIEYSVEFIPTSKADYLRVHALPDRATLNKMLDRLKVMPNIRNAAWKPAPQALWQNPQTHQFDPQYRVWVAECDLDGAPLVLRAEAGWKLKIEPRKSYESRLNHMGYPQEESGRR